MGSEILKIRPLPHDLLHHLSAELLDDNVKKVWHGDAERFYLPSPTQRIIQLTAYCYVRPENEMPEMLRDWFEAGTKQCFDSYW